jgi:membrane protease YdiL (CAAX protease family)
VKPDLTHGGAASWSLAVMFAWSLVGQLVFAAKPTLATDLVLLVGLQCLVYVAACALFAARRPGRSFEELFAFRRAPVALCIAAVLVGIGLRSPADYATHFIEQVFPLPQARSDALSALLVPHGTAHAVMLTLVVGLAGPFVEELLYRGALFTALRPASGAASVIVTTGLLFVVIHAEPRYWPIIAVLAVILGIVRAVSGSLWPTVLLHGAFNGTAMLMQFAGQKANDVALKPWTVAVSSLVSLGALFAITRLAKSSAIAERARALDVRPAPEAGIQS